MTDLDPDRQMMARLRYLGATDRLMSEPLYQAAARIEALSAENERLVERHEAFRQEVSDAIVGFINRLGQDDDTFRQAKRYLDGFIITKPDPLIEVLADMGLKPKGGYDWASEFRTTLARRGLEIREKTND